MQFMIFFAAVIVKEGEFNAWNCLYASFYSTIYSIIFLAQTFLACFCSLLAMNRSRGPALSKLTYWCGKWLQKNEWIDLIVKLIKSLVAVTQAVFILAQFSSEDPYRPIALFLVLVLFDQVVTHKMMKMRAVLQNLAIALALVLLMRGGFVELGLITFFQVLPENYVAR